MRVGGSKRYILCAFTGVILLAAAGCREEPLPAPAAGMDDWSAHGRFLRSVLTPFWEASRITEPLFFVQSDPRRPPSARLLFRPKMIVAVRGATGMPRYRSGKDYRVDMESGRIVLPAGSQISYKTEQALYPPLAAGGQVIAAKANDESRGIFFSEGAVYHRLQVEVIYDPLPGQWRGWVPTSSADTLPRTFARLRAGEPLSVMLSGDSITYGANASKVVDSPPHQPPYPELLAAGLESVHGSHVVVYNNGQGGWRASRGRLHAERFRLGKQQPDLVIIAYGMNDLSARDPEQYREDVEGIMEVIRQDSPETEFILIATMIGNPEWSRLPRGQFARYQQALKELSGPGVAFADMTSIWQELLERKGYYDTTGNGVNHPNDYGHRIYAQVLLAMLR